MSILALDLGTKTGWCAGTAEHHVSGVAKFEAGRFTGGGMRYLRFRSWLKDVYEAYPFTVVYFEEVRRHVATDAAHVYGGLLATLTAWCEENKIAYEGVPVGTIKKFATGKGNAPKDAMVAAVRSWGYSPRDDNEADAIALFRLKALEGVPRQ